MIPLDCRIAQYWQVQCRSYLLLLVASFLVTGHQQILERQINRITRQLKPFSTNNIQRDINQYFRFFIPCIFYTCYNKNYQQMQLFVLCLYFLFLVFSLHVSGFHESIIRGITSCCFYATIWFMQCFVDGLRASADWFVVVTSVSADARRRSTKHCMNQMVA